MKRSLRAWAASIGVGLMAAGAVALLAATPAQAAENPNTITFNPATGTEKTAPKVLTVGPCPAGSDSYRAMVTGPGVFQAGLQITGPQSVNFSTEEPFEIQLENTMLDMAKDNGATAVDPGYYLVTVECRDGFAQTVAKTFTGYMHFDTAEHFITGADVFPGSTNEPTGAPTSASATPTPSTSTSATATPDPAGTTDPTTDPTATTDPPATTTPPTPAATVTTSAAASSSTLPVTGPPAGGLFAIGVVLVVIGGCVVLGTMKFDRPRPARW